MPQIEQPQKRSMNMKKFEMKPVIYFGEGALGRLKEIKHRKVLVIADPFYNKRNG
jgi:alcohol dehydrogenase class IV